MILTMNRGSNRMDTFSEIIIILLCAVAVFLVVFLIPYMIESHRIMLDKVLVTVFGDMYIMTDYHWYTTNPFHCICRNCTSYGHFDIQKWCVKPCNSANTENECFICVACGKCRQTRPCGDPSHIPLDKLTLDFEKTKRHVDTLRYRKKMVLDNRTDEEKRLLNEIAENRQNMSNIIKEFDQEIDLLNAKIVVDNV